LKVARLYLLDTNTVAYVLNGRSRRARRRLAGVGEDDRVTISAITEAEIRYGLAKKAGAVRLNEAVEEFLGAVEILPWDSDAARVYGLMRAAMSAAGKTLSAMDMLIAAHAASAGATLVTSDKAFRHAKGIEEIVDWATDV
jgi:tRNA(fMet)-specific endonuclease VapC